MSRVVIVEDSISIAEALRWVLADEGHDVLTITEGMRGLLDPSHPAWDGVEVLLTDLMMPDVTGVEILQAAVRYAPDALRIALTGLDDSSQLAAQAAQYALVLPKPTDWSEITKAVAGREP